MLIQVLHLHFGDCTQMHIPEKGLFCAQRNSVGVAMWLPGSGYWPLALLRRPQQSS